MVGKKEIIRSISHSIGCSQMQAKVAYEDLTQLMIEEIKSDGIIKLSGVGTIKETHRYKKKDYEFSLSQKLKTDINDNAE